VLVGSTSIGVGEKEWSVVEAVSLIVDPERTIESLTVGLIAVGS